MFISTPLATSLSRENQQLLSTLKHSGDLSDDQHDIVLTESLLSGNSIASLVAELGFVSEKKLDDVLSTLSGYPFVSLLSRQILPEIAQRISQSIAVATCALPIDYEKKTKNLLCAMADPSDLKARDELSQFLKPGEQLSLVMAKKAEILSCIQRIFSGHVSQEAMLVSGGRGLHDILQDLMTQAVAQIVSDIHFEPHKVYLTVKFRCDGVLRTVRCIHTTVWQPLCNQIKVLSGMDITENRRPQDGRFSLTIMGRLIYFRASSHPTIYGESIVLRILEKDMSLTQLNHLGYSAENIKKIHHLVKKPEGLVVITGPTGSGKTTSLYSMLSLLDTEKMNIMTLEEPVEYRIPHVRQSEVKEHSPLTFVTGMHSILRQDPDVILLGEIRDAQTAHMAIRASMTGHKVFTTLHTNNALAVIQRFLDFQVSLSLFVGLFNGIIAQRLIRVLCPACKKRRLLTTQEARTLNLWPQMYVYEAQGCPICLFQGFKGRRALAEVVIVDKNIEELILVQAPPSDMQKALQAQGVRTLSEEGRAAVLSGETSIHELYRVIGEEACI